jgi:uncharacterized membrane protein
VTPLEIALGVIAYLAVSAIVSYVAAHWASEPEECSMLGLFWPVAFACALFVGTVLLVALPARWASKRRRK